MPSPNTILYFPQKRKPDDTWGLPWGNSSSSAAVGKRSKEGAEVLVAGGAEALGEGDRQQQLLNERRARNRRHARETRRRKKESLHDMLAELETLRALKARHEGSLRAARDAQACRRLTRSLELVLALRAQATAGRGGGSSGRSSTATWEARWRAAVAPEAVLVAPMAPYRFSAPPRSRPISSTVPSTGHSGASRTGLYYSEASREASSGAAVSNVEHGRGNSRSSSNAAASKLTFASIPLDDLGSMDSLSKSPRGAQPSDPTHPVQPFASDAAAATHQHHGSGHSWSAARGPASSPSDSSSSSTQVSAVSACGVGAFMAEAAGLAVCVTALTERGLHEDAATQAHWEALMPLSRSGAEVGVAATAGTAGVDSSSIKPEHNRGPPPPKPPKPTGISSQQNATPQANTSSSSTPPPPPPISSSSTVIIGEKDNQLFGATRTEAVPSSPSSVTHCLNPPSSSSSEDEPEDLSLVQNNTATDSSAAAMEVVASSSLPALSSSLEQQLPPPPPTLERMHGVHLEHVLLGDACLGRNGHSVAVPFELRSTNLVRDFGCFREVSERGTVFAEFAPPASATTTTAATEHSALTTNSMDLGHCDDGFHLNDGNQGSESIECNDENDDVAAPLQVVRLELCYDVVAFWRQLQAAKGGGPLAVQPRTLAEARRCLVQAANPPAAATATANGASGAEDTENAAAASNNRVKIAASAASGPAAPLPPCLQTLARAVVSASPPHAVEECNDAWRALVHGRADSTKGESQGDSIRNLHCLLGLPSTELPLDQSEAQAAAKQFATDLAAGRPSSLGLVLPPVGDAASASAEGEAVEAGAIFAVVEATPIVGERCESSGIVAHYLLSLRTTAATT